MPPADNYTYTIFSKSGCINCVKAKKFLQEKQTEEKNNTIINIEVIDCDEYLIENKNGFLKYIEALNGKKTVVNFPIIFAGSTFIGGMNDLILYFSMIEAFDTNNEF